MEFKYNFRAYAMYNERFMKIVVMSFLVININQMNYRSTILSVPQRKHRTSLIFFVKMNTRIKEIKYTKNCTEERNTRENFTYFSYFHRLQIHRYYKRGCTMFDKVSLRLNNNSSISSIFIGSINNATD